MSRPPQLVVSVAVLVITLGELGGVLHIAVAQRGCRRTNHRLGQRRHGSEVLAQRDRHSGVGVAQPSDLRHVRREITHAAERVRHPQCGDDRTKLACDGRLAGQQCERALLDVVVRGVDAATDVAGAVRARRLVDLYA